MPNSKAVILGYRPTQDCDENSQVVSLNVIVYLQDLSKSDISQGEICGVLDLIKRAASTSHI